MIIGRRGTNKSPILSVTLFMDDPVKENADNRGISKIGNVSGKWGKVEIGMRESSWNTWNFHLTSSLYKVWEFERKTRKSKLNNKAKQSPQIIGKQSYFGKITKWYKTRHSYNFEQLLWILWLILRQIKSDISQYERNIYFFRISSWMCKKVKIVLILVHFHSQIAIINHKMTLV